MLHEPASSLDDYPRVREAIAAEAETEEETFYSEIHAAVETVMSISGEELYQEDADRPRILSLFVLAQNSRVVATYRGQLEKDSETAYDELDALLRPHDMVPVFRRNEDRRDPAPHIIHVVKGRIIPAHGGNRLSLILLLLTILSVLYVGAGQAINLIGMDNPARADSLASNITRELWRGWPYALSIMLILGVHEMGHYLMTRRHRLAASLPYFFPFPLGYFGTFGAAIRLREPLRNRKIMLDVGAAGPLAGMIFAVPIVLIGLATSQVNPIGSGLVEGNSILYALSKILVFGRFLPDGQVDVYVNQLAWAGWTGLLITGLNLIPVGQLDGGHILYAILGKNARRLYIPILAVMFMMALSFATELLFFVILMMFLGNYHAVPMDDITPLDQRRRWVAALALAVFVLVFVPDPFSMVTASVRHGAVPQPNATPPGDMIMLPVVLGTLWLGRRRWMRGSRITTILYE